MITKWSKAFRDLLARPGRSWLTVVAMAAGVFQIGVMLYAYALLRPELSDMHGRTRPASATLDLERADSSTVAQARRAPGVAAAEVRPVIVARARAAGGDWVPAMFHVVSNFDTQQLDLFTFDSGAWPPAAGEILLERTALRVAGVRVGDSLTIRTQDGAESRMRVAGTVHAPGMPPAWMEHMIPAFVGAGSRLRMPGSGETAQLRLVATHPLDEGFIRETADSLRTQLERSGHVVGRVTVPAPGRHPHADQMEAFLFLLLVFGLLSFGLSAVLMTSTVHALMAEQVREVGIMKALGATSSDVAGIYLLQIGMLATAAMVLGLPPGLLVGRAYAQFSAGILNTDVSQSPFPVWVVFAEAALGLLVPLMVALIPLWRAARITVSECMNGDLPPPAFGGIWDRALVALPALPRPLALTLRATFARRWQLALGVGLMGIAGAVFMAALNVGEDWRRSVRDDFARRPYDLMVGFEERVSVSEVGALLAGVPGVEAFECWPGASPWLLGPNGVASVTTALVGPEVGSPLLRPRLIAGREMSLSSPRGVVINQAVALRAGGIVVGDSVRVRLRGRTVAFAVNGIARELAPMPVIYAPRMAVLEATGQSPDSTRSVRVVTSGHRDADQRAAARAIESECERRDIGVSHLQRMEDAKQGILDHLVIILTMLTMASVVVVFVGSLGLTTTLTLGVVRRTREFGVMKAIGATPSTIARMVWFEGVLLGMMSLGLAYALTIPLSIGLERACGQIFFKAPLDPYVWPTALVTWFVLVIVLSSVSSFAPARRASLLSVREALAHE